MDMIFDNYNVPLKNIDKMYFAEKGYLKADVIDYYVRISPLLLPHLYNRPYSMIFFPEAKAEDSFYQKQCPVNAPEWIETLSIPSSKRGQIDWCMINDLKTLVYMVNRSSLEMHAWFSRKGSLDYPDVAVLDLDPSGASGIKEAVIVANTVRKALESFNLYSMPKTSGSRGLHIFVPIDNKYTYSDVQAFLRILCDAALNENPDICTRERTVKKRGDKIYLDAVQCGRGKTLAMPYSMRVKSGALVSAPLLWDEVNENLNPKDYDIKTIFERVEKLGDLSAGLYDKKQELPVIH